MSDEEEIKESFQAQLDKSPWWSRLSGSQFVNGMVTFVSQIMLRLTNAADRALQESFLSLASKRSSILAGAEDVGYVGLKISPSIGKSIITNKGTERIVFEAYTPIMSKQLTNYVILNAIDLAPGESIEEDIEQLWLVQTSVEVTNPEKWMNYLIPVDVTAVTHRIDVYVDGELWEHKFKFRNTDPDSKVYMEFYKPTEQLGIRFGDGIKGAIPPQGAVITFDIWCTDGETTLIDNQPLLLTGDKEPLNASVEIMTSTPVTGGAAAETTETTRQGALYTTPYDDEIVWRGDYSHFIRKNVAGIIWISVWGEQDQEELVGKHDVAHINQIYISAYSNIKDDAVLYEEILDLFVGRPEFNKEYNDVTRKELPYTVEVVGVVFSHSNASDAEKIIKNALDTTYGRDVKDKPHRVYEQNIWDLINNLTNDTGIDEFDLVITGLPLEVPVDTYSFLDIENSTITFTYREAD